MFLAPSPEIVSESTRELAGDLFVYRELDTVRVVGRKQATRVFELVEHAGAPLPFPEEFLPLYEEGLRLFRERRFAEAREKFGLALEMSPGDVPASLYVGRCDSFLASPPPADWDGVFDLREK